MQQYIARVHTPRDVNYNFSKVISFNTGAAFMGTKNGVSNPSGCWYLVPPRPENIRKDFNRLTVALDIGFANGYLGRDHFAMGLRHLDSDYKSLFKISARVGKKRFGMGCKAQNAAIAGAMARLCNAAERPNPLFLPASKRF